MANNKDFIVKNAVEVGGATKVTVGDAASSGSYTAGYSLDAASYDSKSFNYSNESGASQAVYNFALGSNGTKLYTANYGNKNIYQYTLSTAYDISTATYDSKSFSAASQATTGAIGITFKTDGTKMYVLDYSGFGQGLYQYSLSTAWDVSTASYDSKVFTDSAYTNTNKGQVFFSSDGTKFYIQSYTNGIIYEVGCSTAWDVSTGTSTGSTLNFALQATNSSYGFTMSSDGNYLFVSHLTDAVVYKYNLSTSWNLSTASYSGSSYSASGQIAANRAGGLNLNADGTKMYINRHDYSSYDDTIYQYSISSTVTTGSFDLSTGNYFTDAPAETVEYTFSNAGDVQSFQLEITPAAPAVNDYFSVDLYTGTGSEQTVTNNLDFSTHGGLLIIKNRTHTGSSHYVFDTVRGATQSLGTTTTGVEATSTSSQDLKSFNTDGFTLNGTAFNANLNVNGYNYVAWCFREAEGFLDIQTYTGNGTAGRTISHNLNADVGMILIKNRSSTSQWRMYNRGYGGTYGLSFPTGNQTIQSSAYWNDTDATTTEFTLGSSADVNANGDEYVAYIFAHNENIQVGTYDGNGVNGREVETGFTPQYIVLGTPTSGTWLVIDEERGINNGAADPYLKFQEVDSEATDQNYVGTTSTGFTVGHVDGSSYYNNVGSTFLYIAVKSGNSAPTITWDADIAWPSGTAPDSPSTGEKDIYTFTTDDGGTTYIGVQSGDAFS